MANSPSIESEFRIGSSIRIEPIFHNRSFHFNDKEVFVLMPFSEPWSDRVWEILKQIISSHGLIPERADNMQGPLITEDIWTGIVECRIVICDTTGWNPNVFYELGVAHTMGKPVVLLTQPTQKLPFDTQGLRHVLYTDNPVGMKKLMDELPRHLDYYLSKSPIIRPTATKRTRQERNAQKRRFRDGKNKEEKEFKDQVKARWTERAKEYEPELPPLGFPLLRSDLGSQRAYLKRVAFALQDKDFEKLLRETKKSWPEKWDGLTEASMKTRAAKVVKFVQNWHRSVGKLVPEGTTIPNPPPSTFAKAATKRKKVNDAKSTKKGKPKRKPNSLRKVPQ